jgi:hypothetical protein
MLLPSKVKIIYSDLINVTVLCYILLGNCQKKIIDIKTPG